MRFPELSNFECLPGKAGGSPGCTSRIGLWPIFDSPIVFGIGGTLIFLATLVFHELLVSKRVNIVTVAGGLYVIVVGLLIPYLISRTDFGVEFVRSLA